METERAALAAEIGALGTETPEMLMPANLPQVHRRTIADFESVPGDGDEGMAAMGHDPGHGLPPASCCHPAPPAPGWRCSFVAT